MLLLIDKPNETSFEAKLVFEPLHLCLAIASLISIECW